MLVRIGKPDILWSVNKLARAVTKWTRACDKRLTRLISYIHNTNDHRRYCHVGKTTQHCRLGLFQASDFAGDLEDSKSTSGELCVPSGVERSFPKVGCARNQLQFHTVPLNLRSYLWIQVITWVVFPLSISGIWLLKCNIFLKSIQSTGQLCIAIHNLENVPT